MEMNCDLDAQSMLLAFRFQSPGPIIFDWGFLTVRWYGLLIAAAVLIGVTLSQYLAKRRGVEPDIIGDLAIWLVIARDSLCPVILCDFSMAGICESSR